MKTKYCIPALLVVLLAGCASTGDTASNDPVRTRVLAELAQARADGSYPLTEAEYIYPNWTHTAASARTSNTAAVASSDTAASKAP